MDFLGRGRSSQEPNHLHGVMSSFPPPPSTFVCFPILVFGLLFVSFHVRLYLTMVLLFLCQQFILLPCHLIMCCVNKVLLCCRSLRMMDLSGLLTCVDVCSFIGITAQVYTLHLGLWRLFLCWLYISRHFCFSVCVRLALPVSLPILFYFIPSSSFTRTQSNPLCPSSSPSLFYTLHSQQSLCFSLFRQLALSILHLSCALSSASFYFVGLCRFSKGCKQSSQ